MKKIIFPSLAVALALLVACNKETGVSERPVSDGDLVEVTVSIRGSRSTKAIEPVYANESKVNNLQVFVFNGDALEAHRSVNNSFMALIPSREALAAAIVET